VTFKQTSARAARERCRRSSQQETGKSRTSAFALAADHRQRLDSGALVQTRASSGADRPPTAGSPLVHSPMRSRSAACDEPRSFATIADRCPCCRRRRCSWGRDPSQFTLGRETTMRCGTSTARTLTLRSAAGQSCPRVVGGEAGAAGLDIASCMRTARPNCVSHSPRKTNPAPR
jgi:hypothetical protein